MIVSSPVNFNNDVAGESLDGLVFLPLMSELNSVVVVDLIFGWLDLANNASIQKLDDEMEFDLVILAIEFDLTIVIGVDFGDDDFGGKSWWWLSSIIDSFVDGDDNDDEDDGDDDDDEDGDEDDEDTLLLLVFTDISDRTIMKIENVQSQRKKIHSFIQTNKQKKRQLYLQKKNRRKKYWLVITGCVTVL